MTFGLKFLRHIKYFIMLWLCDDKNRFSLCSNWTHISSWWNWTTHDLIKGNILRKNIQLWHFCLVYGTHERILHQSNKHIENQNHDNFINFRIFHFPVKSKLMEAFGQQSQSHKHLHNVDGNFFTQFFPKNPWNMRDWLEEFDSYAWGFIQNSYRVSHRICHFQ